MNKIYSVIVICILALIVGTSSMITVAEANQKLAIGVIDFEDNNQSNKYGRMVTDFIVTDISHIKSCKLVERNELKKVFEEQYLSEQGIVEKLNTGSYQGMGINYILMGSVHTTFNKTYNKKSKSYSYKNSATINVKLIDVNEQKGQIVWTGQRTVEGYSENLNETIEEATYDVARQLYEFIPVKGYIIKKDGNKHYIDLGTNYGIDVNDVLEVEGITDSMVHPITGKVIEVKAIIGKLKVKEVYDDFCIAEPDGDKVLKSYAGDRVIREIKKKPKAFLGLGWSGKHAF